MDKKNIKILLGKPGLDGHDVGVKVLAHALIDEGYEVIYSGLRKTIADIVKMAIDNKVDIVGLSILSGTHLVISQQMDEEMKRMNLDTPWFVGGNIPNGDVDQLESLGASKAFATGTTIKQVTDFFNEKFNNQ